MYCQARFLVDDLFSPNAAWVSQIQEHVPNCFLARTPHGSGGFSPLGAPAHARGKGSHASATGTLRFLTEACDDVKAATAAVAPRRTAHEKSSRRDFLRRIRCRNHLAASVAFSPYSVKISFAVLVFIVVLPKGADSMKHISSMFYRWACMVASVVLMPPLLRRDLYSICRYSIFTLTHPWEGCRVIDESGAWHFLVHDAASRLTFR